MIRKNWIIILIILAGLVLRSYHPLQLFQYDHDHDLTGWFIRDVLINHHIRLIGQETSSHGIFIGPYFYYLQIPFYMLTKLDPAGSLLLPIFLGTFTIFSVYFVLMKMFSKKEGLIGALVYSLSVLIIFTDREVVPTMPVVLWTVWFLFALHQILKGKKYGYLILGILIGFIWSINLQLVILLPLIFLAQFLSKKKIKIKELGVAILIALIMNIPFVGFEVRHGFQQTKALASSLTTNKDYVAGTAIGFLPKLDRTMQLVYKNTTSLFWSYAISVSAQITFWTLVILFIFLVWKKKISKDLGIILFLWLAVYILFFTKISLNISEYYLNGMNFVWILIAAVGISFLFKLCENLELLVRGWSKAVNKLVEPKGREYNGLLVRCSLLKSKFKLLGFIVIAVFIFLNLYSFFTRPVNKNGYQQRKGVISYIKEDAIKHGFPCVSLSFIVSPGNNLGYRYFTWELGLKTKPISNNVPVYSIVFPLSMVDKFDKSIGALGVVLPDYKRYNEAAVQKSCEGADYTTAEPMFGFTN